MGAGRTAAALPNGDCESLKRRRRRGQRCPRPVAAAATIVRFQFEKRVGRVGSGRRQQSERRTAGFGNNVLCRLVGGRARTHLVFFAAAACVVVVDTRLALASPEPSGAVEWHDGERARHVARAAGSTDRRE